MPRVRWAIASRFAERRASPALTPVLDGLFGEARLGAVMRQEFGLGRRPISGNCFFENSGDAGMKPSGVLPRSKCHRQRPDQRVLERVLGVRRVPRRKISSALAELRESKVELRLGIAATAEMSSWENTPSAAPICASSRVGATDQAAPGAKHGAMSGSPAAPSAPTGVMAACLRPYRSRARSWSVPR